MMAFFKSRLHQVSVITDVPLLIITRIRERGLMRSQYLFGSLVVSTAADDKPHFGTN